MRLLLKTVTFWGLKAGTKVAPPGLLSLFDRDKETPARLVHQEFLDAQCQRLLLCTLRSTVLLGAIRAKSEATSFILGDFTQIIGHPLITCS